VLLTEAVARLADPPRPLPEGPAILDPRVLARAPDPPGWVVPPGIPPARDAAGLVLLYPDPAGEAHLILTVRHPGAHRHAGQVSLPGGRRDPGDDFPAGTALREAEEEIGLDRARHPVRILGTLDPIDVRVSGFLLVPVVGVTEREPELVPDPHEVARILHVPLRVFLPGAPIEVVEEEWEGRRLRYGAFPVDGYRVWGATGRLLGQLGALLGSAPG